MSLVCGFKQVNGKPCKLKCLDGSRTCLRHVLKPTCQFCQKIIDKNCCHQAQWISGDTFSERKTRDSDRKQRFAAHIAMKIEKENKFLRKCIKLAFSKRNFMPFAIQDVILSYCTIES